VRLGLDGHRWACHYTIYSTDGNLVERAICLRSAHFFRAAPIGRLSGAVNKQPPRLRIAQSLALDRETVACYEALLSSRHQTPSAMCWLIASKRRAFIHRCCPAPTRSSHPAVVDRVPYPGRVRGGVGVPDEGSTSARLSQRTRPTSEVLRVASESSSWVRRTPARRIGSTHYHDLQATTRRAYFGDYLAPRFSAAMR